MTAWGGRLGRSLWLLGWLLSSSVALALDRWPSVTGHTVDGKAFDLHSLRGRPVLVMFWATWCPVCRREMPWLLRTRNQLAPEKLEIVAISIDDDLKVVQSYQKEQKLTFPVLWRFDLEHQDSFPQVRGTPTFYLLAPDGRLLKKQVGALDPALLKTWLYPYP